MDIGHACQPRTRADFLVVGGRRVADRELVALDRFLVVERHELVHEMVERRAQVVHDVADNGGPSVGAVILEHRVNEKRTLLLVERDAAPLRRSRSRLSLPRARAGA